MRTKEQEKELQDILERQSQELGILNKSGEILNINHIERLPLETLKQNFDDFSRCEDKWELMEGENPIEKLKIAFLCLRKVIQYRQDGKYYPYYEDEVFINNLLLGKTIEDMYFVYRIRTDKDKCPLCGNSIFGESYALSRRDNKTYICPKCGMKEAIQDMCDTRE